MNRENEIIQIDTENASLRHRKTTKDSWHLTTHGIQIFENKGLVEEFAPNRLNFYVVALNRNGTAKKNIGLLEYDIQPLTIHFLAPGTVHTLTDLSTDIDGFYICFTSEFYYRFCIDQNWLSKLPFYQNEGIPLFQLPIGDFDMLGHLFQNIYKEQQQRQVDSNELIWTWLQQIHLLTKRFFQKNIVEESSNIKIDNRSALVRRFKKLVDKFFIEKKLIAEYADELLISPPYLSEIVKNQTGQSPIFWLHQRIYLESKYYLAHTNLSAKEIAQTLDFSSAAHFSKFFKKHSGGQTPTEFKQQLKN